MHPIVESKRAELAELCRRRGVRRLELFGSATRDDFDLARSDLDFLVELGDAPRGSALDSWFGLKDDLESMFGRQVDLVSFDAVVNPYIRANIRKSRQLVYGT
ncbi:MAG: DNA polymerase III subunit beta [Leptothrix sp. (in: Bacteria)]|nr:DNA polymerase III subunit beta [Leptothrix sp. (in: b-proteobacteria)]